jgi:putative lipoprotein
VLCIAAMSATAAAPSSLEKAVLSFAGGDETTYGYALADLNGDGMSDAVVLFRGADWCGSGGCTLAIFKGTSDGFTFISRSTVTRAPIAALAEVTNGWHTLAVTVGGGGAKPGQTVLRFDGKKYPLNPTTQPYASPQDLQGARALELQE